jgi:hypothetical protein
MYIFPDGSLYEVVYQDGKKSGEGKLIGGLRNV